jgi:two-component system OmpR family response regulator
VDEQAPRVLVVDDEDNLAYVIASAFRLHGFEVSIAATGRDAEAIALSPFAAERPDLIVLDVMLPDLDGFAVCRHLRSGGSSVPIIFLTARDTAGDRLHGLTIGGDDYVVKPFSLEELLARAKVILRRTGVDLGSRVLRAGELELDDDAHRVARAGEEVTLSPTEYKLLRYLMTNAGRVLSRAQIIDHVWEYGFDGESTVVESVVSSLRRKVDPPPSRLIQTVRGVGYRLATSRP